MLSSFLAATVISSLRRFRVSLGLVAKYHRPDATHKSTNKATKRPPASSF